MPSSLEPISHFFYSHRLKLQLWDWGQEGKPPLILVHGGMDHARNWDFVARRLRERYHVYAMDLRGHGNSQWAPGAQYGVPEHVLDLSSLAEAIGRFPLTLAGHSLGGAICLLYAGIYPDRVERVIAIEGLMPPPAHRSFRPASERLRQWIEAVRKAEMREPRSYPNIDAAVARMKEANPHLTDDVARHLTIHGTNWSSGGSLVWKFDNFVRLFAPSGHQVSDLKEILSHITCPVLLVWGSESWAGDPELDERAEAIPKRRVLKIDKAGHWVHHDQLEVFLAGALEFL